ncbi:MAG: pyruvate kinase [Flavobacteriaceae bacterium]|nr:pyruvate kinase [Psychroflexus sp.]
MHHQEKQLQEILTIIDSVIEKISEFESKYRTQLDNVHPNYTQSAENLIHYLALRTFDISHLQEKLDEIGLPVSPESKTSILQRLVSFKSIINSLLGNKLIMDKKTHLTEKKAQMIQARNSKMIFGTIKNKRNTAIMITQPTEAATDKSFVKSLSKLGMDCARVNCAHDDAIVWKQIIDNIREVDKTCKITMDLAGLKIRTGEIQPGAKVVHIKPKKDMLGQVIAPARVWMAPKGIEPPKGKQVDAVITVNEEWVRKSEKGAKIVFKDARGKKRKIHIDGKESQGIWGVCKKSAFVTIETILNVFFEKESTSEIHRIHDLQSLEEIIFLSKGDLLRLDKEAILGAPTQRHANGAVAEVAHISCTIPEILNNVSEGDPIFFNDGKIGGEVIETASKHLMIEITQAKKKGGKLRADKGINLPSTKIDFGGLTKKDKKDLKFVVKNADIINFSFVNNKHDVEALLDELKKLQADIGIVLKIETMDAYRNLPSILLKAMENYPVGVMIARGDLAIETGWKNFAIIQEEIMQVCNAAQLPGIWATQVLENLTKKGIPTRAEITDAAMAQRAECVMLNKGPYLEQAVKMLDQILCKMQGIHDKKKTLLPRLEFNDDL